jgi:hypothetical protein
MGKRIISKKEENEMIKALNNGMSINGVARKFKHSASTVSRYAKMNNVDIECAMTKKATEMKGFYDKSARMDLLKKGFEKAAWLLQQIQDTREYKDWSMGTAILIDKQRLEEGEPTAINDSNIRSNNTIKIKPEELTAEKKKEIAERYMNETIGI